MNMSIDMVRDFLGYCTLINVGIMLFTMMMASTLNGPISRLQSKIFSVDEGFVRQQYFHYLANYKLLVTVFNLVPWLVLMLAGE